MYNQTSPWIELDHWWSEAERHPDIRYAHAAVLATVDVSEAGSAADARIVLIHERGPDGFVVSTDDASPKADQLRHVPNAALVLHWSPLERQLRIRGAVEPADDATADRCFAERPRDSRVTAWASRQGSGLRDREALDRAWAEAARRFEGIDPVPRPRHWRAWRLLPREVELWQAGARRLHDRRLWTLRDGRWSMTRCWP